MTTKSSIKRVATWTMSAMTFVLGSFVFGACANQEPTEQDEDNLGTVSQAATTQRYVWNGRSAGAYMNEETRGASVNIWEGTTAGTRRAYGDVMIYEADPTSQVCENFDWGSYCYYARYTYLFGWGELPAADVAITKEFAKVQTTVTAGATFTIEKCTIDQIAQTYDCAASDGGLIDLTWRKSGVYESFSTGTNSSRYGLYSYRSQGTSTYSAANAQGTMLGVSMGSGAGAHGEGHLGSGRNVSIEIIRDTTGLGPR